MTTPAQPAAQAQPAPKRQSAPAASAESSTPRLLRGLRVAAAAAALLTGFAATGTLSSDGINATPNVIASQWAAAEQAGVEIAEADLLAATRLEQDTSAEELAEYDALVAGASRHVGQMGERGDGGGAAAEWSTFVIGVERAITETEEAEAGEQDSSVNETYADASASARVATTATDTLAASHADDLLSGGRSILTITVGTVATLTLIGIMVFLALRTRRIINVPLLLATLITAGLTYTSANPSALPLNVDGRVQSTIADAGALQSVYQARQAQWDQAFGAGENWQAEAVSATEALERVNDNSELLDEWALVTNSAGEPAGIEASQTNFDEVQERLEQDLEQNLGRLTVDVSAPAILTSGGALLFGLLGAALAWTGLSRRLRDYR